MNFHIPIDEKKLDKISDKFLITPTENLKLIDINELSELNCSELIFLLVSADWFIANKEVLICAKEHIKKLKKNYISAINNILNSSNVYVIWSERNHLPFLFNARIAMLYTDKEKAYEVAQYFSGKFREEKISIGVKEYSNIKEFFELLAVCGQNGFSIDGRDLVFHLNDFFAPIYESFGNVCPKLSYLMHQFIQIRDTKGYGVNNEGFFNFIKSELIRNLKQATFLMATDFSDNNEPIIPFITKADGSKWQPLFTDQLAVKEYFQSTSQLSLRSETFSSANELRKADKSFFGIVINPGREELEFDRALIDDILGGGLKPIEKIRQSEHFYVLSVAHYQETLPMLFDKASAEIFTSKENAWRVLQQLSDEEIFAKEYATSDLPKFMNYCRKNGIKKIFLNPGTDDDPDLFDVSDYFGAAYKLYHAGLANQLIIRIKELTGFVDKGLNEYKKKLNAYLHLLYFEFRTIPFLVPIVYDGEDENVPVHDEIIHITDFAAEFFTNQYFNEKLGEGNYVLHDESGKKFAYLKHLDIFGSDGYRFAGKDDIVTPPREMHVRTVNNGPTTAIPAFTDFETLFQVFGKQIHVAVFTFEELARLIKEGASGNAASEKISGIIINPTGNAYWLDKLDVEIVLSDKDNPFIQKVTSLGMVKKDIETSDNNKEDTHRDENIEITDIIEGDAHRNKRPKALKISAIISCIITMLLIAGTIISSFFTKEKVALDLSEGTSGSYVSIDVVKLSHTEEFYEYVANHEDSAEDDNIYKNCYNFITTTNETGVVELYLSDKEMAMIPDSIFSEDNVDEKITFYGQKYVRNYQGQQSTESIKSYEIDADSLSKESSSMYWKLGDVENLPMYYYTNTTYGGFVFVDVIYLSRAEGYLDSELDRDKYEYDYIFVTPTGESGKIHLNLSEEDLEKIPAAIFDENNVDEKITFYGKGYYQETIQVVTNNTSEIVVYANSLSPKKERNSITFGLIMLSLLSFNVSLSLVLIYFNKKKRRFVLLPIRKSKSTVLSPRTLL